MSKFHFTLFILLLLPFLTSCEEPTTQEALEKKMQNYLFDEIPFLPENPYTPEKEILGEKLFAIGCTPACHLQEFGYTSGNPNFPGGFGRGFTPEGGINVFDDRGFDFPGLKALGVEYCAFRKDFGASARFPNVEEQAKVAQEGHRLIPYDTLFSKEIKPLIDSAFQEINIYDHDTAEWDIVIAYSIAIWERMQVPELRFYNDPIDNWTPEEKENALLFIEKCGICHSRVDFSGPPSTLNRPLLPFHPDNCAESDFMEDSLRAVPNLINVYKHTFFMYDGQEETYKEAVLAHSPIVQLDSIEVEKIEAFQKEFLTSKD